MQRAETLTIAEQMQRFSDAYAKRRTVNGVPWRYYVLGTGSVIFMLPGGLRRAAYGFAAMQQIARRHAVVAVDFPRVMVFDELVAGFDAILRAEGVDRCAIYGQSYGGLLAQAYAACRPDVVERLVLSSTRPADYGRVWLPLEQLAIRLVRVLPDRGLRRLLGVLLARVLTVPDAQRDEWRHAVYSTLENDLCHEDIVSHFAVMADIIRRRLIHPGAFRVWRGDVVVLAAVNDPTQRRGDRARFDALFGRSVTTIGLGTLGHTAALMDPEHYAALLERALTC
jgi:pimeloyl-ACP methyl ester carboxylesterase